MNELTTRERFAMAAMQLLYSKDGYSRHEHLALDAVNLADAMLSVLSAMLQVREKAAHEGVPKGWRDVIEAVMLSVGAGDGRDRKSASADLEFLRLYTDAIAEGLEELEQGAAR